MRGENGVPETPDWRPHPKPSPFDAGRMSPDVDIPETIELGEN